MGLKFSKIVRFIKKRAKEKSTYVGLAAVATALGAPHVGAVIDQYSTAALLILGSGLVHLDSTTPSD